MSNREQIVQIIELSDLILQHRRQRYNHDDLRKLGRLQGNRSQLYPALCAQSRMPQEHNRQQHDDIEYIEPVSIPLQHLVIEIH